VPITPEQLAKPGHEHDHQKAVCQAVALTLSKTWPAAILLHAIPNGSRLMGTGTTEGNIEGNKMKAEGLRPGVPDMFLPVLAPRVTPLAHPWPGLYLEMKVPGRETKALGGRTDKQQKWHRDLVAQGYAVATAYGWQAGVRAITDYLSGRFVLPPGGDCAFYS